MSSAIFRKNYLWTEIPPGVTTMTEKWAPLLKALMLNLAPIQVVIGSRTVKEPLVKTVQHGRYTTLPHNMPLLVIQLASLMKQIKHWSKIIYELNNSKECPFFFFKNTKTYPKEISSFTRQVTSRIYYPGHCTPRHIHLSAQPGQYFRIYLFFCAIFSS